LGVALNIKNTRVEQLVAEVAELTGETKTQAILHAMEERKRHIALRVSGSSKGQRLREFLEREAWPAIPRRLLGKKLPKKERERILGYGPEGV
jgi:antitoxin VapB